MMFAACVLYLVLIVLLGYGIVSLIHPGNRAGIIQMTGLASAVGAGTMGCLLFWVSLMGYAPSRRLLVMLGVVTVTGLLFLKTKHRLISIGLRTADGDRSEGWPAALLLLLAGAMLALMAAGALSTPLAEWDALAVWGFKAKVVAHDALRPTPACFHDLTLTYSHLDYPLMLPFLTAGAYAAMGAVDDQAGKLVSVFLDMLLVPVVYAGLRWKLRRLPAAAMSGMMTLLPVIFRYTGVGCADLPLAMFYAGSVFFVAKWIEEQQGGDLILAILFSAFVAFTKNEGLVLALANGLVLLGFGLGSRRPAARIGGALFFAGLLAIDAAWLWWSRGLPRTYEDYGSKLLSPLVVTHLPKLKQIIPAMMAETGEFQRWGLLWVVAGVMALMGWRAFKRRYVQALWVMLGLHLASYALAYSVTPWNLAELLLLTLDRLLLHALPAVVLLIGWHWAEVETHRPGIHPAAGRTDGTRSETLPPATA
jgi:hypothetical protein